jgi:hypothetical protein
VILAKDGRGLNADFSTQRCKAKIKYLLKLSVSLYQSDVSILDNVVAQLDLGLV